MDIYAFDPPAPADEGTLRNVVVNSTDEVLKLLLRADMANDKWIAGWENHKENLPEDPSQARLAASQVLMAALWAALCNIVQLACHDAQVPLSQYKHIMLDSKIQAMGSGCASDLTRHMKLKFSMQKAAGMTDKQFD